MINEGQFVQIDYTGKFEDGEVFDTSVGRTPLEFKAGAGMVIPGLDKAVIGMNLDEQKEIAIAPEDAYGDYDETRKKGVPKDNFPDDMKPEPGMKIAVQLANGNHMPAEIVDVGENEVTLDMNHPLAGKTLYFDFKIIAINDQPQMAQCGPDCGGGDGCSDPGCSC